MGARTRNARHQLCPKSENYSYIEENPALVRGKCPHVKSYSREMSNHQPGKSASVNDRIALPTIFDESGAENR